MAAAARAWFEARLAELGPAEGDEAVAYLVALDALPGGE